MKIYLVGGAVRDKLLGLPVRERDWVVVGATPAEMLALGYRQVGKDFPVFLHPQTQEEYALARTERKTAPGYRGFAVHAAPEVTLEQDLLRRDLTINAMAEDSQGRLIDPFHGQEDLRNGLLRHISPAFCEDPVRILRAARFAARFGRWGFKVADDTNTLMCNMVASGEVDALVPERVWAETHKALCEEQPHRYLEVLRGCGALARIFPEIDALFGVPQPEQHHAEIDTGIHIIMVLRQAARISTDPQIRFAALVHDLGKGATPRDAWPQHVDHEQLGAALVDELCTRLRIPNEFRDLGILTARYHSHCHRAQELKPATILKVLEGLDAFRRPERLEKFLLACQADAQGRRGTESSDYPQADIFRTAHQACTNIDNRAIIEAGYRDKAFREELRRRRIDVIKKTRA